MMKRKHFIKLLGSAGLGSAVFTSALFNSQNGLIKPQALHKGDTIGVISPGSPLHDSDRYDRIVKKIRRLGYNVKEGPHARDVYGYLAGSDEHRAADLNAMFADNSVDAILPFRGGWGSNRILDRIDFEIIRNNPKILIGFSDITSLLLAIYTKADMVTFHGPVGKSDWSNYTKNNLFKVVSETLPHTVKQPDESLCANCNSFNCIAGGKAEGRLLGGNLSVLTAMMGSEYLPDWRDNILFIEDVGEKIYSIDRMLTELKLTGVLQQISGFIFGQCTNCRRSATHSLSLTQVLEDHIKPLGIPAFSGAMFGHISQMITLPVGLPAQIDSADGTIFLNESAVSS